METESYLEDETDIAKTCNSISTSIDKMVCQEGTDPHPVKESYLEDKTHLVNTPNSINTYPDVEEMFYQESADPLPVGSESYLEDETHAINIINAYPEVKKLDCQECTGLLLRETESYLEDKIHVVDTCSIINTDPDVQEMKICQKIIAPLPVESIFTLQITVPIQILKQNRRMTTRRVLIHFHGKTSLTLKVKHIYSTAGQILM